MARAPTIGQTRHDTAGSGNAVAAKPFVHDMTSADKLLVETTGARANPSHAVQTAQGIAQGNVAANQNLDALSAAISGHGVAPTSGALPARTAPGQGFVASGAAQNALRGAAPVALASAPAPRAPAMAPGFRPPAALGGVAPAVAPGALQGGAGQAKIDRIDAALAGLDTSGAPVAATDASGQLGALDRVLAYDANAGSAAQAQLANASQANLANSLALARSARGGPGAQAAAMRRAQAEGAATMSQQARDSAVLRAQDEDTRKQRELQALGLGGEIAGQARTADITERGQDIGVGQADAQRALDATIARGGLAQSERSAGVTERGQTIQGALGAEQIKQARDAVSASALSDAEKTEANILMTRASLGYSLSPEQQFRLQQIAAHANDPTTAQYILSGIQAGASVADAIIPG